MPSHTVCTPQSEAHIYVRTLQHTWCTKPYPKASLCWCRLWCCRLFSFFPPCLLFLQKLRVLHSSCICLPLPLLSSCGHSLTPHFLHQCMYTVCETTVVFPVTIDCSSPHERFDNDQLINQQQCCNISYSITNIRQKACSHYSCNAHLNAHLIWIHVFTLDAHWFWCTSQCVSDWLKSDSHSKAHKVWTCLKTEKESAMVFTKYSK